MKAIPLIIFLGLITIQVLEALHDDTIRRLSNKNPSNMDITYNRRWHKIDAMSWLLIYSIMSWLYYCPMIIITGLTLRFTMFSILLNLLMGQSPLYLSNKGMDGFFKKYSGVETTFFIKIMLMVCIMSLNLYLIITQKSLLP